VKRVWIVICCAAVALAFASSAGAQVSFGINEDIGAVSDPNAFYGTLSDLGITEYRIAVQWDASKPMTIPNQATLDYWIPAAAIHAVRVVFVVSPAHPRDVTASRASVAQFAAFLQQLARAYPYVHDFVVGNEPNQNRFWQPQFTKKKAVSGAAYEPLLAAGYDALKAVSAGINVVGIGLSPRGNDNPLAKSDPSTSPVRFIHDVGVAYRASKRKKPIMDELGFHPYPNQNADPPLKGYPWPKAGLPNLDRIKQAVWDAFNGTKQPTFNERGKSPQAHALKLDLDETAWQVAISSALLGDYFGTENVIPVDETTQAQYYQDIIRFISCDPDVRSLSFFHLIDERDLDRWQSGLLRVDGTERQSYTAVKSAIKQTNGTCALPPPGWSHTTTVTGAKVTFGPARTKSTKNKNWRFAATAQEDATYVAGIFRLGSGKITAAARKAITKSLAKARAKPLLGANGPVVAYHSRLVVLPKRTLKRSGWYVYGIRVAAAMNSQRSFTALGKPFRVRQ
jgi:hypothetical protein